MFWDRLFNKNSTRSIKYDKLFCRALSAELDKAKIAEKAEGQ